MGFENFCSRALAKTAPRAQGPPRLAAGAGDRNAETLKNFYVLECLGQFSRAFSSGSDQRPPRAHRRNASSTLGAKVEGAADAPAQSSGATSLFPAKREVKREVGKAWQAWPGNQTSWKSLVRSLVGRGWAKCSEGRRIRTLLAENCFLHESVLAPFPLFRCFGPPARRKRRGIFICPQVARSAGNSA